MRITDGKIVSIEGPRTGSAHDVSIWKGSSFKGLLKENEFVLGDKGYQGDEVIIVPWKKNQLVFMYQWAFNLYHAHYRITVERTLGRMKFFKCLQVRWRHELSLHHIAFYVIANIVNIDLFFHPLFAEQ